MDNFKCHLHSWYLDDGSFVENSRVVAKSLDIIWETGQTLDLDFNIRKIEIICPTCDENKFRDELFSSNIGRSELGMKLLESVVSQDTGFIERVAINRGVRAIELLVIRSCMGVDKLVLSYYFFVLKKI
jgi:hypothetical protein